MFISDKTKIFIQQHINSDSYSLALNAKTDENANIDVSFALEQIKSRQRAKEKLHNWYSNFDLIFPPAVSVEQCSSESAAKYKANLCKGKIFIDLTGGFGVDFAFLSQNFEHSIYLEKDKNLAEIAKHNFDVLNLKNIEIKNCDSHMFIDSIDNVDCIYIDPSRRSANNKKEILLENCSPDILEIKDTLLQKSNTVLIKLSPVFEIAEVLKKLDNVKQIHIIAVKNECKELLVLLEKNCDTNNIEIICANISNAANQMFSFRMRDEKEIDYECVQNVQKYLYEPNASIQKSGGFKSLAKKFNLKMLNINSKIYTSNTYKGDFCGRIFTVENVFTFNKNEIKTDIKSIQKANITVRNFPLSVADLRKKLNIAEGGEIYLFATTLFDGKKVIVKCHKDTEYL
jgi:16S rRNA G966 N2-methylase RsmD